MKYYIIQYDNMQAYAENFEDMRSIIAFVKKFKIIGYISFFM